MSEEISMSGYLYGEEQPTEKCPYCKALCEADFVDIGVGFTQCGPYHCEQCGASEIGPNDTRELSDDEKRTGWYTPGAEPSEAANVIGGKIVSHRAMRDTYKAAFTGNPDWADKGKVDQWWKDIRRYVK